MTMLQKTMSCLMEGLRRFWAAVEGLKNTNRENHDIN